MHTVINTPFRYKDGLLIMQKKQFITFLTLIIAFCNNASSTERMARIIGGETANSGAWPWMAGLVYNNPIYTNGVFCGASLIAKDWVLTAAHCVIDLENSGFDVIINQPQLELDSVNGERIQVDFILVHPLYNDSDLENDLALIKLATPSHNPPINVLAPFTAQDNAGKSAIALGWGSTTPTSPLQYPVDLQQVDLPLIDNFRCNAAMKHITEGMLCAGDGLGERDTCFGDSGGPLVVFDTESHTWRQAGITSWGFGCAAPDTFGVYTRLKNYARFISDHICSAAEKPASVSLNLALDGNIVAAGWDTADDASGYRLNYAPYPDAQTIHSFDVNSDTGFSTHLGSGSAYYVAISSYNGNCISDYSNIEHFIIK